jgi:membrane dipeptidase
VRVFDGHNDALLAARRTGRDLLARSSEGHWDVPRAREGGFAGGFFAIFVPTPGQERLAQTARGYEVALAEPVPFELARSEALAMAEHLRSLPAEDVRPALGTGDVEAALAGEQIAAIMHLEGAEPIDPGLDSLAEWHAAGLRSLGPVWSRPNAFATGVPFAFPRSPDIGPGLTDAGRALVRACNELRILIDLSHINERGFWDVAELSAAPLVATHSGVHALCASTRNLTDAQLDAIGDSGGVAGITFHVPDIRPDAALEPDTPLDLLADHVLYVAERIGVAHVALGSDFDGALMPRDVGDVSRLPALLETLARRGLAGEDLAAVAHGNWLRVLRATWGP